LAAGTCLDPSSALASKALCFLCFSGRNGQIETFEQLEALTGKLQHDHAPPDRPSPAHQAEEDGEELADADDQVDDEGADARPRSVFLGEAWFADAQAEEAAQDGACKKLLDLGVGVGAAAYPFRDRCSSSPGRTRPSRPGGPGSPPSSARCSPRGWRRSSA
jgi:hypothetical protein